MEAVVVGIAEVPIGGDVHAVHDAHVDAVGDKGLVGNGLQAPGELEAGGQPWRGIIVRGVAV